MNNIEEVYPLSPMQEGLLSRALYENASDLYLIQNINYIRGISCSVIKQAWDCLVLQYPILRTGFYYGSDKILQYVMSQVDLPFYEYDWGNLTPDEQDYRFHEFIAEDRAKRFDLTKAPLMRISTIKLADDYWIMIWSFHHILLDGWSVSIILNELFQISCHIKNNKEVCFRRRRLFKDYITWLLQQNNNQAGEFWKRYLSGYNYPARFKSIFSNLIYAKKNKQIADVNGCIPEDYSANKFRKERNDNCSGHTSHIDYCTNDFIMTKIDTDTCKEYAKNVEVTLATLILGCIGIVTQKYLNQDEVVIGITTSGRTINLCGIEEMVGIFINTLPIRIGEARGKTLTYFTVLQQNLQAINKYGYISLSKIQNLSSLGNELFDILFVYENYSIDENYCEGEGLTITKSLGIERVEYPLTVVAILQEGKLKLRFSYQTEHFDESSINNLYSSFKKILLEITKNENVCIEQIDLLSEEEKRKQLIEWNQTEASYPNDKAFQALFEEQVLRTPNNIAAIHGKDRITYIELNYKANQLARYLKKIGVSIETPVIVVLGRSIGFLITVLAIFKVGGIYVPIDGNAPDERNIYIYQNLNAKFIITDNAKLGWLSKESKIIVLENIQSEVERESSCNLNAYINKLNLAYIIFTSGSTGLPKGVMITHQGMINHIFCKITDLDLNKNDIIAQTATQIFDISIWQFLTPLLIGGRVVIFPEQVVKEPEQFLQLVSNENITILELVPAYTLSLILYMQPGRCDVFDRLKHLIITGEALQNQMCKLVFDLAKSISTINAYGPTECSDDVTHYHYNFSKFKNSSFGIVPIGKPLSNLQLYILDNNLNLLPIGVTGEIYIGGVGLARGYINRPDLTAERFIANPFNVGDRLYKTGDLGRFLPDGNIEFLGRIDNQVKIRGFRIELGEIEKVIGEYVREAVVLVKSGENDSKQLVAYIVPKEVEGFSSSSCFKSETGEEISVYEGEEAVALVERIRNELASKLPEYMVPSYFVVLSKLPLNLNGKTDSKILQSLDHGRILLEDEYVAPRNEIEGKLCKIWEEVLKVERVGINDNFFRIGGDSIIAIQVTSRARKGGLIFAVKDLFTNQTISKLSEIIADNDVSEEFTYEAAKSDLDLISVDRHTIEKYIADSESLEDGYLLSPMQEGLLLSGLSLRNDTYFIQNVFYTEFIDIETAKKVWNLVANRHSMLRSGVLFGRAGQNIAYVMKKVDVPFFVSDWSTEELTEKKLQSFISRDREIGFDLSSIPLMRVNIVKLPKNRFLMIWSFHHVLLDGWSASMVLGEVIQAYKAILKNAEMAFVERRPYKDYVGWIKNQDQEKARQFWQKYFVGIETPTQLTFKGAIEKDIADYKSDTFEFNKYETEELHNYAQSNSLTLNTLLIGAIGIILQGYLKQDDIIVGMTASGRSINLPQIEHMVGLFINTVPIRINKNKQGMVKFLSDLQTAIQFASEYGYVSLSSIQKWSGLGRNLFNILFVYENYPIEENCCDDEGLKITKSLGIERIEYPLTVVAMLQEGKLKLRFSYQTEHFNEGNINSIYSSIKNLLLKVAKNEHLDVERIELLTDEEKRQQLVEWNRTEVEYPKHKSIHEIFEKQVMAEPEATAVIFKDQRVTYKELNSRANQLAHHLRKLGVTADTVVGIGVERSIEMIVGILGILKAGGAYLPLDPSYPAARLRYMLEDSKAKLLLIQEGLRESFAGVGVKTISFEEEAEKIAMELQDDLGVPINLLNLAYIIYTSGSTGQPKGVGIPIKNVIRLFYTTNKKFKFNKDDVWTCFHSFAFDFSVWEIFGAILFGGRLIVVPYEKNRSIEDLCQIVSAMKVTVLNQTPSAFYNFVESASDYSFPCLRTVIFGGEALEFSKLNTWFSKYGERIKLINMYGITESTVHATYYKILCEQLDRKWIGKKLSDLQLYILDNNLNLLPIGVTGEIYIGGVGLARGYINRPDLTAERFIANPFNVGDRLYKTGDLGRFLPDGNIEFLGRIDNQVKIRGFRIELGEIEKVIGEYVREVVVLVKSDENDSKQLVAYIVPKEVEGFSSSSCFKSETGEEISVYEGEEAVALVERIRNELASKLPEYMVPSYFVVLSKLPLNLSGKTDSKILQRLDHGRILLEDEYVAPRNEIEGKLCKIWEEVLKVERVGINDNFFRIGGDSIIALQIIAKTREVPALMSLSVIDIFESQTIKNIMAVATSNVIEKKEDEYLMFSLFDG